MGKMSLLGASALRSAAFASAFAFGAAPAFAQDTAPATPATSAPASTTPDCNQTGPGRPVDPACVGSSEQEIKSGTRADSASEIVVTGSRIRRPNLDSPVPVTSLNVDELLSQGDVNVGDALNDLPAIRSTYSQANSTRFIGTAGVNFLDLRGLGITRTLVLVNGRRHITASPGDFIIDTNTIPTDLLERVDVITGGSSAVYGSDAVAGVVNFILKNNYNGFTIRGQGGISDQGDRGIYTISATGGKNFNENRGNVAFNVEYVKANPLYFRDRPRQSGYLGGRCQFNTAENTAGEPQSGNGVPDQQFFCGVRNVNISNGGTLIATGVNASTSGSTFATSCVNPAILANPTLSARCLNPGTPLGQPRIYRFNASGQLVQDIPTLDFRPFGSGNYLANPNQDPSALGSDLRATGQFAPGLDRKTANLLFNYEFTPALKVFAEGKYVKLKALQEGQPSFFQSIVNTIGTRNISCDYAYLTAANLASLQSIGYCSQGATNNQTIPIGRFNVDFGGRSEIVKRDTYRIVGGVRGDFNDDWNYELSVNYGHVKIHQDELNDLKITDIDGNLDGFSLAYQAVRNAAGQIVCRVNQVTVTRPDCVPINVLGNGAPSADALRFVNTTSFVNSRASELDILGFVNGDSSQLFELPGGPIRFSIGGEYRRETAYQKADPLSSSGGTFFNAFSEFDPPAFTVKEVFGELEVPILKDRPFFHELSLTGAARYSKYNTSAGSTWSYNINGVWAPVRDLRFRANYSKSVRVPTLSDLFSAPSQNFAFLADPCDVLNINNGTPNRPTNCAAQGIPAGFVNANARAASTGFLSAGNPDLTAETGKSLTIGGVLTPRFVPGFTLSVDYYRIKVQNLIAVLGAQTILNQCYDLPQPNEYCLLLFPRNADFSFGDPALTSAGINFAKFQANGVDLEAAYRKRIGEFSFDTRLLLTYVLKRDNYTSPTNPAFRDRILSELGDPKVTANFSASVGYKAFDLRYTANFIGKQTIGAYENYFSIDGRPPQNPDLTLQRYYPSQINHSARLSVKVGKRFNWYVGVDNIFDSKPPFGLLGNEGGNPYDGIGRYYYSGFRADF